MHVAAAPRIPVRVDLLADAAVETQQAFVAQADTLMDG